MANLLTLNTDGSFLEITPPVTSAGSASSGQVPALNSVGQLDPSFMPTGIGADTLNLPASEAITAGAWVNLWNNTGVTSVRNALAADNTKPCHGFVLVAVSSGATATVYFSGPNSLVPLGTFAETNIGQKVFLSPTVAGGCTLAIPTTSGQIAQVLGSIDAVATTVNVNFTEHPFTVRG